MKKIVIDTNVIVSALKSRKGASNKLITLIGSGLFRPQLSVPLVLEYEAVIKREFPDFEDQKINAFLDYLCSESDPINIYYLWRPQLKDPCDELVLELAVTANADIITYNSKDFKPAKFFDIEVLNAKDLLQQLGEIE